MKGTFTQSLFLSLLRASFVLLSGLLLWMAAATTLDVHIQPISFTIILLVIGSVSSLFYPVLRRFFRRLQRGDDVDASRGKVSLPLFLLLLGGILSCGTIQAQVTGSVFRDYNGNGTKDANEPLVSGVLVSAYLANSNTPCGTATSAGTTAPNFSVSGCGTADVRVEFEIPTTGTCANSSIDFTSLGGTTYGSSVQFVQGNSTDVNFALYNPADYNQGTTNVSAFVPRFTSGDPLPGGSASGALPYFVGYPYTNSGGSSTSPSQILDGTIIGSTWGVAYSKQAGKVFTAAFLKRHTGLGTLGSGGIYMLTPTANSFTATPFYNLDANGHRTRADASAPGVPAYGLSSSYSIASNSIVTYSGPIDALTGTFSGLGVIGSNTDRVLSTDPEAPTYDPAAFDQVGKVGLGDIDISDDGKFLFVMNLYSRKVFRLELDNATNPTAVMTVTSYDLPSITCTNGEYRPFGLKFYRNKLYVGVVCSGENSGVLANVNATVYELNNPTGAASFNMTALITVPLGYNKYGDYNPWTNNSNSIGSNTIYPQPILSNIEFTDNGDMVLNIMDRAGHQYGEGNRKFLTSANTATVTVSTSGDVLIAGLNCSTGAFTLENNGSVTSANGSVLTQGTTRIPPFVTGTDQTIQGPGGREFFYDDSNANDPHRETAVGSSSVLKGQGEIFLTAYAMTTESGDGGTIKLSTTDGEYISGYAIYNRTDFDGVFAKAGGLGDIELMTPLSPIEIGNRVWMDTDDDGIQDAGEVGLGSIPVKLFQGATQVGATITASNGSYYFNNSNVNLNGATGLLPNTAYVIRVDAADFPVGKSVSTKQNIGGAGQPDVRDNDAALNGGNAEIAVTTGKYGENNHTLDMAFKAAACALTAANETLETCNNNGTTATGADDYITFSLNPTGTDLGASYSVTASGGATVTLAAGGAATGIAYGAATAFRLQNGSANGTLFTITVTDVSGAPCVVTTTVQQSACSTPSSTCPGNLLPNGSVENGTFSATTVNDGNGIPITTSLTSFGGSTALLIPNSSDPTEGHPITGFKVNTGYWVDASSNGGTGSQVDNRLLVIHSGTGSSRCIWPGGMGFNYTVGTCYRVGFWAAQFDPTNLNATSSVNFEVENQFGTGIAGGTLANFSIAPSAQDISDPNFQKYSFNLPSSGSTAMTIGGTPYTGTGVVDWKTLNWQYISFDFTPALGDPPLNIYVSTNASSEGVALDGFCTTACAAAACALTSAGKTLETCNNNGTTATGADDYITFSLNPTGTGLGASYSVTASGGATVTLAAGGAATGIAYGAATAFRLQNGSASGTSFTITVTDVSGAPCVVTTTVQQSACSTPICAFTVTSTVPACHGNGTPELASDDYITFTINAANSLQGSLTYTVTATQGGNPIVITLANGSPATAVNCNLNTPLRTPAGTAGDGPIVLTITDNVHSCNTTTNIADPGSCAVTCVSGTPSMVMYSYGTQVQTTDLNALPIIIPKFDDMGGTRTLTSVKLDYEVGLTTTLIMENNAANPQNFSFDIIGDAFIDLGVNTIASPGLLINGPTINFQAGIAVPMQGSWPGDVSNSTLQGMQPWLVDEKLTLFKDPTTDSRWVTNATGDPTDDDDIAYFPPTSDVETGSINYSMPVDLANFTGVGNLPLTVSTSTGISSSGGGGNVDAIQQTRAYAYAKVTYTFNCAAPCALTTATKTLEACNDNGTTGTGADDYITFSLNPTGTGLGASYNVTASGGATVTLAAGGAATGIAYGAATAFRLQNGSANGTSFTITVTDVSGAPCVVTTTVQQSACSTPPSCNCEYYMYLNDVQGSGSGDGFVHKFRINSDGTFTEIFSNPPTNTIPWFPTGGGLPSPHGLAQDLNGNIYIGEGPFGFGNTDIRKISCSGTMVPETTFKIDDGGYNFSSRNGILYVNSAAASNRINAYNICDGSLIGWITLAGVYNFDGTPQNSPNAGGITQANEDWGFSIAPDGTFYATSGIGDYTNLGKTDRIYRFTPSIADFTAHTNYTALITSASYIPVGITLNRHETFGITSDPAGNMYVVVSDFATSTRWILKYNSSGTLVASISEANSTPTGGFEGGRGIAYHAPTNKVYVAGGQDGDCVAVINPSTLAYEGPALGHVPGQFPKGLAIVKECCPGTTPITVNESACFSTVGQKFFLADFTGSCDAPLCAGGNAWTPDPGNSANLVFNVCDNSVTVNGVGCGTFTLTNPGVGNACGAFTFTVNLCFNSPAAATFSQTAPTCTGATANNNGIISFATATNVTNFGISTAGAAAYDGPAYPATTFTAVGQNVSTTIPNTGGTYIVRVFNGAADCFTDVPVTVTPVNCAAPCALTAATKTLEACNDNGTTGTGADDYISFSLNPTGTNTGASYSVTADNGGTVTLAAGGAATGIAYGSATAFRLQNGSSNGTLYTITVTDVSGAPCVATTTVQQNTTCSAPPPCALTAITFANPSTCSNNGTNTNASDDYFTADITVTFSNPPATGNLVLTGDVLVGGGATTVTVATAGAGPTYTFVGVRLRADGTASAVTATFSADNTCTFSVTNGPNVPSCSNCVVPILATSNGTVCTGNSINLATLVTGNSPAGTLTFYTSQSDANAGTNVLVNSTVAPIANTTYYVRSETAVNCFSTTSVSVTVNANPAPTVTNGAVCSGGSIDLATLVTSTGGGTLSFYATQADANAGTNALGSSTVSPTTATNYYVRSTAAGCYGVKEIIVTISPVACGTPTVTGPN